MELRCGVVCTLPAFPIVVIFAGSPGDETNFDFDTARELYFGGSTIQTTHTDPGGFDNLVESILNDAQLHIGALKNGAGVNNWDGLFQLIEI